jgi:hypothetical protein
MNGFSVGFSVNAGGSVDHPTDAQYKGLKRVYSDVELLEISCVAIPACPEALIEQVKSGKIVSKQLKDEMDHIIELVEKAKTDEEEDKAPSCPGGGAYGADYGKYEECKGCEYAEGCKSGSAKEEEKEAVTTIINVLDADAVKKYLEEHPEMVQELVSKATPKCPADGEYGMDYGSYDECEGCSFAEGCEEKSEGEKEKGCSKPKPGTDEEEGGRKKKPVTKEDSPSIYDLVVYLNRALADASMVVDVTPSEYPNGSVIYSKGDSYYRSDYQYDTETGCCELIGESEELDREEITIKYEMVVEQKESDVVVKEGRVLSEKNRKLLKECIDKMGECSGMLSGFHEATGKPEAYTNIRSVEEDDEEEGFEIEQKEIDLSDIIGKKPAEKTDEDDDDALIEIEMEMLKGVLKSAFAEGVQSGAETAIKNAVKKIKGNVI